jgi:hypothetical protein
LAEEEALPEETTEVEAYEDYEEEEEEDDQLAG